MFDSLADQIRHDENEGVKATQRIMRWAAIVVISIVLFGGLYFVVRLMG